MYAIVAPDLNDPRLTDVSWRPVSATGTGPLIGKLPDGSFGLKSQTIKDGGVFVFSREELIDFLEVIRSGALDYLLQRTSDPALDAVRWRSSSRGRPGSGVQIGILPDGRICFRDGSGQVLIYTPEELEAFIAGVKNGEFDLGGSP